MEVVDGEVVHTLVLGPGLDRGDLDVGACAGAQPHAPLELAGFDPRRSLSKPELSPHILLPNSPKFKADAWIFSKGYRRFLEATPNKRCLLNEIWIVRLSTVQIRLPDHRNYKAFHSLKLERH